MSSKAKPKGAFAGFADCSCSSVSIESSWKSAKGKAKVSKECQTDEELYRIDDKECQTGFDSKIVDVKVNSKMEGLTLSAIIAKVLVKEGCIFKVRDEHNEESPPEVAALPYAIQQIMNGCVTVATLEVKNGEENINIDICREHDMVMQKGTEVSIVVYQFNEGTQKSKDDRGGGNNGRSSSDKSTSAYSAEESKDSAATQAMQEEDLSYFLGKVSPIMSKALADNCISRAFDHIDIMNSVRDGSDSVSEDVIYWKKLSVDLEKNKVILPDWSSGKFQAAKVARMTLTRTKERRYDIDFDDNSKLLAVREEHIRIVEEEGVIIARTAKGSKGGGQAPLRVQDGVRVFALDRKNKFTSKVYREMSEGEVSDQRAQVERRDREESKEQREMKNRLVKKGGSDRDSDSRALKEETKTMMRYLPGRVKAAKGGYEVECEGGTKLTNLALDDLLVGISPGQTVEVRRPVVAQLQCTSMSWNASGSTLAVAFGNNSLTGWCDLPGAVCVWSLGSLGSGSGEPNYVLDHPSCITTVSCHPESPSIIAGGSFNGEVIIWDLNSPETAIGVSAMTEYSHKEPINDLKWMFDKISKKWLLTSIASDGRFLIWDYQAVTNKMNLPVKGLLLSLGKQAKRTYPSSYGGRVMSFTSHGDGPGADSNGGSEKGGEKGGGRSQWLVVGLEGGNFLRAPVNRLLEGGFLSKESFKTFAAIEDIFQPFNKSKEAFSHECHIGSVESLDASPFVRNMFISGGGDGCVKLFNVFDRAPLHIWEPLPPPHLSTESSSISPISCVRFSPHRPTVFAASSFDGFIYIFDLGVTNNAPVMVLELPLEGSNSTKGGGRGGGIGEETMRPAITNIAFNNKKKGILSACDSSGKIHLWRLSHKLSSRTTGDVAVLQAFVDDAKRRDTGDDDDL